MANERIQAIYKIKFSAKFEEYWTNITTIKALIHFKVWNKHSKRVIMNGDKVQIWILFSVVVSLGLTNKLTSLIIWVAYKLVF